MNDNQNNNSIGSNPILLSLDCWTKFIEGFIRGLESSDKVNTSSVMDCIGEILEYICSFKPQLTALLEYCESILQENIDLKEKLKQYEILNLEEHDGEDLQEL